MRFRLELFSVAANDPKGSNPNDANCKNDFRCINEKYKKDQYVGLYRAFHYE